jgi:hypothetical protein
MHFFNSLLDLFSPGRAYVLNSTEPRAPMSKFFVLVTCVCLALDLRDDREILAVAEVGRRKILQLHRSDA